MPRGLTKRVGEQAVLGYTRRGRRIGEVDLGSDGAQSRSGTGVKRTVDCWGTWAVRVWEYYMEKRCQKRVDKRASPRPLVRR
jgi:hypothetical protein